MPAATWWKKRRSHGRLSRNCVHCGKGFTWRSEYLGRYTEGGEYVALHVECFIPMRDSALKEED